MKRILVFAGTTEGRRLVEQLQAYCETKKNHGLHVTVCVATEYGQQLLPADSPYITVLCGRLLPEQMEQLMKEQKFDGVVDTTHPYAVIVTENIRAACEKTGAYYIRLLRQESELFSQEEAKELDCSLHGENGGRVIFAADTKEAAAYLQTIPDKALLTTGSKELEAFTEIQHFAERLYPRVLPMPSVIEKCHSLGYQGKNLICMQGPFTLEMNLALLKQTGCTCLVTKNSGTTGGFYEKAEAARQTGATLVVIGRRPGETGCSFEEVLELLEQRLELPGLAEKVEERDYFPMFVPLGGKNVLVIGAGAIALRRIRTLLSFHCNITAAAAEAGELVKEYAEAGLITWRKQELQPQDREALKELLFQCKPYFVLAASNSRELNRAAAELCRERGIPVNVSDCKEECDFYFPGIAKQGALTIGITANGMDHKLARKAAERIREVIKEREL